MFVFSSCWSIYGSDGSCYILWP